MQQMPGAHGPDALGIPQQVIGQVHALTCMNLCHILTCRMGTAKPLTKLSF